MTHSKEKKMDLDDIKRMLRNHRSFPPFDKGDIYTLFYDSIPIKYEEERKKIEAKFIYIITYDSLYILLNSIRLSENSHNLMINNIIKHIHKKHKNILTIRDKPIHISCDTNKIGKTIYNELYTFEENEHNTIKEK